MDSEAIPQQTDQLVAIAFGERFAPMRVQVVQNQMNRSGLRIAGDDLHQVIGELDRAAVRCGLRSQITYCLHHLGLIARLVIPFNLEYVQENPHPFGLPGRTTGPQLC